MSKLVVPDVAAHMFIFYYAVLSEVSPPTALSPFAAAAITGGDPYKTTMQAWKYTLPAFLVPFVFVLDPQGLGLLLKLPKDGSWIDIVEITVKTALGLGVLAMAAQGWALRRTTLIERALLMLAGLLLVFPSLIEGILEAMIGRDISYTATFGVVIAVALFAWRIRDKSVDVASPNGGRLADSQQVPRDRRAGPTECRQQVVPDSISKKERRIVRGIVHELQPAVARVRLELSARDLEKWTKRTTRRVQTGQTTSAGAPNHPHQDGLQLIIRSVGRGDASIEPLRDVAQEIPPGPAQLGFGAEGLVRAGGLAGDAQTRGSGLDKAHRLARRLPRPMIEGGDHELVGVDSACRCVEKRHRIQTAGHGEDDTRVRAERRTHRVENGKIGRRHAGKILARRPAGVEWASRAGYTSRDFSAFTLQELSWKLTDHLARFGLALDWAASTSRSFG